MTSKDLMHTGDEYQFLSGNSCMKFVDSPVFTPILMRDLHTLDLSTLIDMLAEHTESYTKLFAEKNINGEEFARKKEIIRQLQAEIDKRKQLDGHVNISGYETP